MTYARTVCPNCGARFTPKQYTQAFCKPACKTQFWNRMKKRGGVLAPLAMAYRTNRKSETSVRAHVEFCRLIAQFNEEDRLSQRPPAWKFVERQYRLGQR